MRDGCIYIEATTQLVVDSIPMAPSKGTAMTTHYETRRSNTVWSIMEREKM